MHFVSLFVEVSVCSWILHSKAWQTSPGEGHRGMEVKKQRVKRKAGKKYSIPAHTPINSPPQPPSPHNSLLAANSSVDQYTDVYHMLRSQSLLKFPPMNTQALGKTQTKIITHHSLDNAGFLMCCAQPSSESLINTDEKQQVIEKIQFLNKTA